RDRQRDEQQPGEGARHGGAAEEEVGVGQHPGYLARTARLRARILACPLRIDGDTQCRHGNSSQCVTSGDEPCITSHKRVRSPLLNRQILLLSVPPWGLRNLL